MKLNNLADIGVNLYCKQYAGIHDIIIKNAQNSNVTQIISISNSLKECNENIKLCKKYSSDDLKIKCTIGVHPHNAKLLNSHNFKTIRDIAEKNREHIVAIGECGLDYNRMFSPDHVQRKWFEDQIKLAIELDLPLYFHERDAHKDFVNIVSKYKGKIRGVVHCFTGSKKALMDYIDLGFYIGITGWVCDERRGQELQSIVPLIPMNRILLETDSPFLTPRDIRPRPKYNEPKYVYAVAKKVSGIMRVSPQTLVDHANANRKNLFGF